MHYIRNHRPFYGDFYPQDTRLPRDTINYLPREQLSEIKNINENKRQRGFSMSKAIFDQPEYKDILNKSQIRNFSNNRSTAPDKQAQNQSQAQKSQNISSQNDPSAITAVQRNNNIFQNFLQKQLDDKSILQESNHTDLLSSKKPRNPLFTKLGNYYTPEEIENEQPNESMQISRNQQSHPNCYFSKRKERENQRMQTMTESNWRQMEDQRRQYVPNLRSQICRPRVYSHHPMERIVSHSTINQSPPPQHSIIVPDTPSPKIRVTPPSPPLQYEYPLIIPPMAERMTISPQKPVFSESMAKLSRPLTSVTRSPPKRTISRSNFVQSPVSQSFHKQAIISQSPSKLIIIPSRSISPVRSQPIFQQPLIIQQPSQNLIIHKPSTELIPQISPSQYIQFRQPRTMGAPSQPQEGQQNVTYRPDGSVEILTFGKRYQTPIVQSRVVQRNQQSTTIKNDQYNSATQRSNVDGQTEKSNKGREECQVDSLTIPKNQNQNYDRQDSPIDKFNKNQ